MPPPRERISSQVDFEEVARDTRDFTDLKIAMMLQGAQLNQLRADLTSIKADDNKKSDAQFSALENDNRYMRRTIIALFISVIVAVISGVVLSQVNRQGVKTNETEPGRMGGDSRLVCNSSLHRMVSSRWPSSSDVFPLGGGSDFRDPSTQSATVGGNSQEHGEWRDGE